MRKLWKLPEHNSIPPSGPNPEVPVQSGSSIKTCLKSGFWPPKKFHPQIKSHPQLIITTMPSTGEKLEQLAAMCQEHQCKEEEECKRELELEEELHAEME